ncbi:rRNA maturation RNase YbeY [Ferruginibacter sp. HRS2-29]|nr:rRNA maturation RNase YbeY [Ferruginibacter sp. HRS2-29]
MAFHFQKKCSLKNRLELKQFITSVFNKEKTPAESLNVIFCDDEYLLDINRTFLSHDYYTDIITFNLAHGKDQAVQAELYISIDRVRDNAISHYVTNNQELHRVIFHGVLHLCGYKDKSKKDILVMRQMENKYLNLYFKS